MLVDSHCHLDFSDFATEREAIIARARSAEVETMLTICTRLDEFEGVRAIAESDDDIWCSVGVHPHEAKDHTNLVAQDLAALAEHPKVIGIGETGLDFHYDLSPRDIQAKVFRVHVKAARATGLPLVVHTRDADEDCGRILQEEAAKGPFRAVLHCYTGGRELAMTAIELGLSISFTGILTFKKSEALRALAAELPADRIMVETDAPYLAPGKFRGKRNEPAYVVEVAKVLAEARGVSLEEISRQTTENFFRLFSKVPSPKTA